MVLLNDRVFRIHFLASTLTCHLGDRHEGVLGDGVRALAGEADVRVRRGNVDDDAAADVSRAVAAGPTLGLLLEHGGDLCAYADEVTAGVDVHDAVEVVNVRLSKRRVHSIVDLVKQ